MAVGIEEYLGTHEGGDAGGFGVPLVPADEHADGGELGLEDLVAQVAGGEVELLVVARVVGDVHLAVFAQVGAVGVDDGGGVVVEAFGAFFEHRADDDHAQLLGQGHEMLRRGPVGDGLGQLEVLVALLVAEIERGEELLQANDLGSVGGELTDLFCVALNVLRLVGDATHLRDTHLYFHLFPFGLKVQKYEKWPTWQNNLSTGNNSPPRALLKLMIRQLAILCSFLSLTLAVSAQGDLTKGLAAEEKGLYDLAESYYRKAVDTSAQARLHLGMLLEKQEHFSEAAQWLVKADSSALAMTHLAVCQAEGRDWEAAKRSAEKAIEQAAEGDKAQKASAMATLALAYCVDGELTNAITWAHQAQEQDSKSVRALNVAGIIQFYRGNDEEATKTFRKAVQADPKNIDAYFNLGSMYCYRNMPNLAITTLKKGLKEEQNSIKLLYCLGWAYLLKGESQNAIESLQRVITKDSTYVDAYNRLGDIYFERGEYNQALAQYRKAIKLAPKQSEAYKLMGRTYAEMEEYGKAISQYQKAVELNKKDAETYCHIAELYAKKKQPKREQANYKRAAKLGHAGAQKWCTQRGIAF